MLKDAERLAREGRSVYVIAANAQEAYRLQRLITPDLGIKVESAQGIRAFDWDSVNLLGAHPSCRVLVDHFAAEQKCDSLEQEIQRLQVLLARTRSLAHIYDNERAKS